MTEQSEKQERFLLGWCERCSTPIYNTDRINGAFVNDAIAMCKRCVNTMEIKIQNDTYLDEETDVEEWDS